ncbi:MAG: efflux RND transporter permease subunit [Candidatus Eremiobacteraeota bacterium]|nr:efflux RND transporter permease subunit [Candidatus Eremiobacteraeota bacterium]MCW5867298.1 efflux RND transporter permease subunit [Candidatus Eremiobacteraeota bacterium]
MDIAELSVRRPVATWMRILIFVVLGALAYTQLPVELLPDITRPSLFVVTSWTGVSPEDLEYQITRPVEDVVATVPGLSSMRSDTSEGSSRVTLEFAPGYDMAQAALDTLQLVQKAQRQFPTDDPTLQAPTVQKFDPNSMPILVLGVSGISDPVRLRSVLTNEVKPILESAEGVGSADVAGGQERAIVVQFDSQALLARGLSSQDLVTALSKENQNVPGGTAYEGNQQLLVRSYGWIQSLRELQNIPVGRANGKLIPLKAVARVVDSHLDTTTYQRLNGEPAGSLNIIKQASSNTVTTVSAVLEKLKIVEQNHPELHFEQIYNQSRYVSNAVHSLQEAAVVGGLLAMAIVLFFLRNFRSTLVVATSIPVSVISTFSFLYMMGYTLNTMSLVGLALATGLIVDDAVVVMESVYRKVEEEDMDPEEAAIEGTRPIVGAVISSTLTIMVVFFPMLLIPGQTGQMFKQFALVVIISMAFSLLDALTGVPMLCAQFIRKPAEEKVWPFWQRQFHKWEEWLKKLDAGYARLLESAMGHRNKILIGGCLLTLGSLIFVPLLGFDFMPGSDTGTLRMQVTMPKGTSLEETDKAMQRIESVLAKNKDVASYLTTVGAGGGGSTGRRDQGNAWIALKDSRRGSSDQVGSRLQVGFNKIPAVRAFPSTMDIVRTIITGQQGQSIEIDIFGPDLARLAELSADLVDLLKTIPGLQDLRDRAGEPAPEVRWVVDRDKASQLGLSFSQVASALQTASAGTTASYFQDAGVRAPIVVQLSPEARRSTVDMRGIYVNSDVSQGGAGNNTAAQEDVPKAVQLRQVARATQAIGYATISRSTRQRYAALVSAGEGRALSDITADVTAAMADFDMPDGYSWDWSATMKAQSAEFGRLWLAGALAVMLIYMLLCIQFENLIVPLSIMMSVPLCTMGIVLALFLTGTPFSVMSGVGCLLLVGISVKNGILLIENTLQARDRGLDREAALLEACPTRLRPILITALAAMLGMVPIAMRGRGGELEAPMAITVIGGLFVSTLLTLVVVPMAYLLLDDFERRFFKQRKARA